LDGFAEDLTDFGLVFGLPGWGKSKIGKVGLLWRPCAEALRESTLVFGMPSVGVKGSGLGEAFWYTGSALNNPEK
jgi:hypothetical protein